MHVRSIIVWIILLLTIRKGDTFRRDPEIIKEALLEPTALIQKYGYEAENHTVSTADGFQLTMHRIPTKTNSTKTECGLPLLLMHGMNFQSLTWFNSGPNSLAFLLSDVGCDVWMGNYRGTSFSKHIRWSRKDKEFWNYTLDDHVTKDLPAMIDYVLEKTGNSKLIHVGQSLGTTVSFFLFADNPQYNEKVAGNVALGPALSFQYVASPLYRVGKQIAPYLISIFPIIGVYSWMDLGPIGKQLTFSVCPSDNTIICDISSSLFSGFDPYLPDKTRIPIYATQSSSGVSINVLIQIFQAQRKGRTSRFDFGPQKNLKIYGSMSPPEYNFTRNLVPTVLFYGANDPTTDPLDVLLISRILPNVIGLELVPNPMFTHSDYTWARNAKTLVYDKLIEYVKSWSKQM